MSSQAVVAAACAHAQPCSGLPVATISGGNVSSCSLSPPTLRAASGSVHSMWAPPKMQRRLGIAFGPARRHSMKAQRPCQTVAALETESQIIESVGEEPFIQVEIIGQPADLEHPKDGIKLVILQNEGSSVADPAGPPPSDEGFAFTINGQDVTSSILGEGVAIPSGPGYSFQILGVNTAETEDSPGPYALKFDGGPSIDIPIFQGAAKEDGGVSVPGYPGLKVSALPGVAIVSPGSHHPKEVHMQLRKVIVVYHPTNPGDWGPSPIIDFPKTLSRPRNNDSLTGDKPVSFPPTDDFMVTVKLQ